MKTKILVLIVLVIAATFYFFWQFKWTVKSIAIDPQSIRNIDGGLGLHGEDMGYVWSNQPKGVRNGDLLYVTYADTQHHLNSSCKFTRSESYPEYTCQATWPIDLSLLSQQIGYDKSHYTFTDKLTLFQFLLRFNELRKN
jgi:hypothetical protein